MENDGQYHHHMPTNNQTIAQPRVGIMTRKLYFNPVFFFFYSLSFPYLYLSTTIYLVAVCCLKKKKTFKKIIF